MDTILNSIISMEKKAQELIDNADAEKQRMLDDAKKHCDDMRADITKRQEARLAKVADNEQAIIDARVAEIEKDSGKKLDRLESVFQQNKSAWVEDICRRVTGGEGS